jgi:hypothetical protein
MEEFSYAYIHLLASANGYQLNNPRTDYMSVDVVITSGSRLKDFRIPDPSLNIQLKSTSMDFGGKDFISYPLPAKNYHDLIENTNIPQVLILIFVPPDSGEWITHRDITSLNAVGYYLFLRGERPMPNKKSITITIPKSNILTTDKLHEWMCQIAEGELL